MRHDHEILSQAILVLNEAGEEGLGAESQVLEHNLSGLLAGRHPNPELSQPLRPRDCENLPGENSTNTVVSMIG